ncbi:hypothetical protein D9M68_301620 [compost metagenome]
MILRDAERPAKPPPMMTTSAVVCPSSRGFAWRAGSIATHPETPVFFGSLDATNTFFEGVLTV